MLTGRGSDPHHFSRNLLSWILALLVTACSSTPPPLYHLPPAGGNVIHQQLNGHYLEWRGTPYQWGGTNRSGIDCSAFVQLTYSQLFRIRLPRSTRLQAEQGNWVSRQQLVPGDIVFFRTGPDQRHNGIYLDQGLFMHASASRGVIISSLDNPYWSRHYWKSIRLLG